MKTRFLLLVPIISLLFACSSDSKDGPADTLNPWDGKYRMEGTMTDLENDDFGWAGNTHTYQMETTSSTQIKIIADELAMPGIVIANGINLTFYGTFGLLVNFNPSTNKITSVTNFFGQPSESGRSAVLDPSGANEWNPETKNFTIKFWMDEDGAHRTAFDVTCVYIGAR